MKNYFQPARVFTAGVVLVGVSACAAIVTGDNQPLSIATNHNGEALSGATCTLANDEGTWFATTPGSVTVKRSYEPLNIVCKKDDIPVGNAVVHSSTKAMAFGNILFGGIIGAAVDAGTGAAFDYPALIEVEMGRSIEVLPDESSEEEQS